MGHELLLRRGVEGFFKRTQPKKFVLRKIGQVYDGCQGQRKARRRKDESRKLNPDPTKNHAMCDCGTHVAGSSDKLVVVL
jgi:hypothetical protein